MRLENIFAEAKVEKEYIQDRSPGFELIDEYDEDGNLITIVKFDHDNSIAVHIQDTKNNRHNYHVMSFDDYHRIDFGNFKRLINELFFYAQ